jgi:alpha-beta hydrolase superfamily lysophospholipase
MKRRALLFGSILFLVVAPGQVQAQAPATTALESKVESGEINGAAYRIDIPANWNKGLVMYAHGYNPVGAPAGDLNNPRSKALRDVFLSRGFAFAQSSYSAQGWAVKEGIEDTEALRRHFVMKYGKPTETYITGHSMGGHISIATIERYPEQYSGAMPMCGPLGPAIEFMNTGVFDMLVTFEALFPGTVGSPYEPSPATPDKVRAAIVANPEKAAQYAQHFNRPVEQLPGVLAFFQVIAAELKQRAGGEPFDNTNRIYNGFGNDAAFNRTVKRYAANPAAREYLRQYFSPTGHTADPVLTIQTTADQLVLGRDVSAYEVLAARAGASDKFVARFVDATGHCNFTPGQTGGAFDALLAWVREGKRPAAGEQK